MIAIIPARGGSKGLPGKNIKELCGKPMIAYTVEAALKSKHISRVIVSTDDENIANVAKEWGAEVPFLRPKELASDTALAIDTYVYTAKELSTEEAPVEEIVVLLPTSPLRNEKDIDEAIDLFKTKKADSVISCAEAIHPPVWAKRVDNNGVLLDYFEANNLNRQQIPQAFMPNGAIYVFTLDLLENKQTYYTDKTYAYVMPVERSFDIDTLHDFQLTELYLKHILNNN